MKKTINLFGQTLTLFFLLLIFGPQASAQIVAKKINTSTGRVLPFLQFKPSRHDVTGPNRRYPMIIFLHGGGERSSDTTLVQPTSAVWQLTGFGPLNEVSWYGTLAITWNNKPDTFIVLQPLSPVVSTWPVDIVDAMIKYGTDSLKADTNRIYLTGHSYGGAGVFNYLNSSGANVKKLAAAVPVAAWNTALYGNGPNNVSTAKLPVWGFHALDDTVTEPDTTIFSINRLNAVNPEVKPLLTLWPAGYVVPNAHNGAHNYVYQTHIYPYLENGVLNIYEWFLGQNNDSLPNILPVARANSDTTIFSSSGVANLNGSNSTDADGSIVRYVWRKISGAAGDAIATPFGTASSTTVSGLTTAGTYKYQLNVVDNRAAIARDTITITVVDTTSGSGKAVSMLTTSSRIIAGNVAELNNSTAFTIEAYFKYDSIVTDFTNAEASIFRKLVTSTDRIRLYVEKSTRSIHFVLANGTDVKGYTPSNVVSNNTWYHVAAIFDGAQTGNANRLKIFINGVQQTLTFTGTIGASTSGSTGSTFFGGEPSASQVTVIDEVRLWDTVVSPATINAWKYKLLGNCHPNFNKLTIYWPLNNNASSSTAVAALGTIYPGSIINGSYVNSPLPFDTVPCPAYAGKALSMLTTSSRIIAGNVAELNNSTAFTIEAHFKYDSIVTDFTNAEASIFRKLVTSTDRIRLYVEKSTRSVHFVLANGSDIKGYTSPNVVSNNTWYHVAAVFDGSQTGNANRMKIFINGVQQALTFTGTISSSTSGSTGSTFFGGEPSASQVSVLDEARLWNTALSSTTIDAWRNKLLGTCHPNFNKLTIYWPLNNDASASIAVAALGTIYPGSIINGSYTGSNQAIADSGCGGARLAQVPIAGKLKNESFINKVYPNPTDGYLQLEINAPVAKRMTVNVIDMNGKYLYRNITPLIEGMNRVALDITSLPAGMYIIEVNDGGSKVERYKILKR